MDIISDLDAASLPIFFPRNQPETAPRFIHRLLFTVVGFAKEAHHSLTGHKGDQMRRLLLFCATIVGLAAHPAKATTYNLSFSANSSSGGRHVSSQASFAPITLFDGDKLSIVFTNVPLPTEFPAINPATFGSSILFGQGDNAIIEETITVSGAHGGILGNFMSKSGPDTYFTFFDDGGLIYGPSWTISLLLVSGEPALSSGLTVDEIRADLNLVPLPATLPLFLTGLSALGLIGRRGRKSISAQRLANTSESC